MTTTTARPAGPASATFEELYRAQYPALMRLGFLLTGSDEAAGDLVHGVLLCARRRLALDDPPGDLRAAMVNACRSEHRRAVVARRHEAPPAPLVMPRELVEFRDLLLGLPFRQRAALVLRTFCDLSDDDVGDLLRCRPDTVQSLLQRGLGRELAVTDLVHRLATYAHAEPFLAPEPSVADPRRRRLPPWPVGVAAAPLMAAVAALLW